MERLLSLIAISPIDGRYAKTTEKKGDCFSEPAFLDDEINHDLTFLRGQAASAGNAQGRATVVKALENFKALDGDTVLVCPSMSRELIPFFPRILALVTNTGGALTPAAAVARECGIPTVVGTSCATEIINDGDIVCVDGTNGLVKIIPKLLGRL